MVIRRSDENEENKDMNEKRRFHFSWTSAVEANADGSTKCTKSDHMNSCFYVAAKTSELVSELSATVSPNANEAVSELSATGSPNTNDTVSQLSATGSPNASELVS